MILANGCNITKSEKFKGVWILSVPTVSSLSVGHFRHHVNTNEIGNPYQSATDAASSSVLCEPPLHIVQGSQQEGT